MEDEKDKEEGKSSWGAKKVGGRIRGGRERRGGVKDAHLNGGKKSMQILLRWMGCFIAKRVGKIGIKRRKKEGGGGTGEANPLTRMNGRWFCKG